MGSRKFFKILIVDDDPKNQKLLRSFLLSPSGESRYKIISASSYDVAFKLLGNDDFDVALLGLIRPDNKGLYNVARVSTVCPALPIVVIVGAYGEVGALKALRRGAQDYLLKGKCNAYILHKSIRYSVTLKKMEVALKSLNKKVRMEKKELCKKSATLQDVLQHMEEEKKVLQRSIESNVDKILMPSLSRLKTRAKSQDKKYFSLFEKNLKEITSPFIHKLSRAYSRLSFREIQVSNLIKEGLSSKEIAGNLNISALTVNKYRENIRKKLEIKNKKVNLVGHLQSL